LDTYKQTCKCNVKVWTAFGLFIIILILLHPFKLGHVAEAIQECTEVLKYLDENDLDVLLNRGEAYLLNEQYDKG
jgi:tetratricopeptide (TPR) repeat protein